VKELEREILLSFWKAHILHHAGEKPLHGQWVILELRRHGYEISAGTLYPLLHRMERLGWLKGTTDPDGGKRARKDYRLTSQGRNILRVVREHIKELHHEVVLEGNEAVKERRRRVRPKRL
jgi:DNA-binding PadR family transcriptional regulator